MPAVRRRALLRLGGALLLAGACLGRPAAAKHALLATAAPTPTPSPFFPPAVPSLLSVTRTPPGNSPASAGAVCGDSEGQVLAKSSPSNLLGRPLEWTVYLPPCFGNAPASRYPLLVLLHPAEREAAQWAWLGIAGVADQMIHAGQIAPLVMVFPQSGSEAVYDGAILADLLPTVDQEYRILPDRAHHAIGGLSSGGAQALRLGLQRPDLFGAIGVHSLTPVQADLDQMQGWLAAIPSGLAPRVYFDIGDQDPLRGEVRDLAQRLKSRGLPLTWVSYPGTHSDTYWAAHLEDYLRWYSEGWH